MNHSVTANNDQFGCERNAGPAGSLAKLSVIQTSGSTSSHSIEPLNFEPGIEQVAIARHPSRWPAPLPTGHLSYTPELDIEFIYTAGLSYRPVRSSKPPCSLIKKVAGVMHRFVADQVLGINGLVNFSNIVFLAAFSVRDVLKLRILAIVGDALSLPYYYFQGEKLWPPIFWAGAFIVVNAVRVVATALERRPVVLSDKEEQLYRVAFSCIDKREFLRLVSLARWVDCSPGEVILEKGEQIADAIVLISGNAEAILGNKTRLAIRPGQLVGDASAYSGLANPVDIVARDTVALAKWELRHLREFTASRPDLRANLLRIVSMDLAAKLHDVAAASSGSAVRK